MVSAERQQETGQRGLKKIAELLRGQSGILCDTPHSEGVYGIVTRDDEPALSVRHDDVSAFPRNAKPQFLEDTDGLLLRDSGNSRHASNRYQFAGERQPGVLGVPCGVFFGDFQPKADGLPDVLKGICPRGALRMTARERWAGNGPAFTRFHQRNSVTHGANIEESTGRVKCVLPRAPA